MSGHQTQMKTTVMTTIQMTRGISVYPLIIWKTTMLMRMTNNTNSIKVNPTHG